MSLTARIFFGSCMLLAPALSQNSGLSGTIDGAPIPERVFNVPRTSAAARFAIVHGRQPAGERDEVEVERERMCIVCDRLRAAVSRAARVKEVHRRGISATPEDVEETRRSLPGIDPVAEAARMRERAALILSSLAAVEKGADSKQVYEQTLKARGITELSWQAYMEQARSPAGKTRLLRELAVTPQVIAQGVATADLRPLTEARKLDRAVDGDIAASDATFALYLEEFGRAQIQGQLVPLEHKTYLDRKRAGWWRSRVSTLQITLSDVSLENACRLSDLGVGSPK